MREPRLAGSTPVNAEALSRQVLVALRTRALRRGVWFRVLSRIERGLVDLTIRWVDKVRSGRLARVLLEILGKLVRALESRMVRADRKGWLLASRLSELALGWGDERAFAWWLDAGFQRALGLGRAVERIVLQCQNSRDKHRRESRHLLCWRREAFREQGDQL